MIRYTSHRDLINCWYIGLTRAGLPVQYTEGFSKKPRVSFGPALPLGVSSECEYADLYLKRKPENPETVLEKLGRSFPAGYSFKRCERVETPEMIDLAARIKSFCYDIAFAFGALPGSGTPALSGFGYEGMISSNISSIMGADRFEAENNGKIRDIRPYLISFGRVSSLSGGSVVFDSEIAFVDKSTIKPQLLLPGLLRGLPEGAIYTYSIRKRKINF